MATTADPTQTFLQNLNRHYFYMDKKAYVDFKAILRGENLKEECAKHVTLFKPLIDRNDYFDEVLGSTFIPFMSICVSMVSLINSILNIGTYIAIKTGFKEGDQDQALTKGINNLTVLALSVSFAISIFVKSSISLITRPLSTIANGWSQEQLPDDRFDDNNDVNDSLFVNTMKCLQSDQNPFTYTP